MFFQSVTARITIVFLVITLIRAQNCLLASNASLPEVNGQFVFNHTINVWALKTSSSVMYTLENNGLHWGIFRNGVGYYKYGNGSRSCYASTPLNLSCCAQIGPQTLLGGATCPTFELCVIQTAVPQNGVVLTTVPTWTQIPRTSSPAMSSTQIPIKQTILPSMTPITQKPVVVSTITPVTLAVLISTSPLQTETPLNITTGVPKTNIPHTDTPLLAGTAKTVESASTGAAVASSVAGGSAAGSAMRMILISGVCEFKGINKNFPLAFHPTQLWIDGSQAYGAIIGNTLIIIIFTAILKLLTIMLSISPRFQSIANHDPEGFLRFPSCPLFIFQFLYQGTTFGSLLVLFNPPNNIALVVAFTATGVCVLVPIIVFRITTKGVPGKSYYAEEKCNTLFRIVAGPGEWVSRARTDRWSQKYASAIRAYRQRCCWFASVEMSISFVLSLTSSLKTENFQACAHVRMSQAGIFALVTLLLTKCWPYSRPRDNVVGIIISSLQVFALLLMAVAFYLENEEHHSMNAASALMTASAAILIAKVVVDLLTEIFIFFTKRRTKLQEKAFEQDQEDEQLQSVDLNHSLSEFSRANSALSGHSKGRSVRDNVSPSQTALTEEGSSVVVSKFRRNDSPDEFAPRSPRTLRRVTMKGLPDETDVSGRVSRKLSRRVMRTGSSYKNDALSEFRSLDSVGSSRKLSHRIMKTSPLVDRSINGSPDGFSSVFDSVSGSFTRGSRRQSRRVATHRKGLPGDGESPILIEPEDEFSPMAGSSRRLTLKNKVGVGSSVDFLSE